MLTHTVPFEIWHRLDLMTSLLFFLGAQKISRRLDSDFQARGKSQVLVCPKTIFQITKYPWPSKRHSLRLKSRKWEKIERERARTHIGATHTQQIFRFLTIDFWKWSCLLFISTFGLEVKYFPNGLKQHTHWLWKSSIIWKFHYRFPLALYFFFFFFCDRTLCVSHFCIEN